jgi:tetratricopeptide (TPR) repeat protein
MDMTDEELTAQGKRRVSYNITFEALLDSTYDLPAEGQRELLALYHLVQDNPRDAIIKLEELLKRFPGAPRIYNYLAAAYSSVGQRTKARALAQENYRLNPEYLFAKLNWLDVLVSEAALDDAKRVMADKWEISMHCPGRDTFHVSEVIAFAYSVGRYLAATGKLDAAEIYLGLISDLAPNSEQEHALEDYISLKLVEKGIHQLARMAKGKRRKNRANRRKR